MRQKYYKQGQYHYKTTRLIGTNDRKKETYPSYNECLRTVQSFNNSLENTSKLLIKKLDTYYLDLKNQLKNFVNSKIPINHLLDSISIYTDFQSYKYNISYSITLFRQINEQFALQQIQFNLFHFNFQLNSRVSILQSQDKTQLLNRRLLNIMDRDLLFLNHLFLIMESTNLLQKQSNMLVGLELVFVIEKSLLISIINSIILILDMGIFIQFLYLILSQIQQRIFLVAFVEGFEFCPQIIPFWIGDIIIIEVDKPKKKIAWLKKKTHFKFIMNKDTNQDFYPCANLCSPGDTVEIINKIEP